jgi:chromosome segregation ATPase
MGMDTGSNKNVINIVKEDRSPEYVSRLRSDINELIEVRKIAYKELEDVKINSEKKNKELSDEINALNESICGLKVERDSLLRDIDNLNESVSFLKEGSSNILRLADERRKVIESDINLKKSEASKRLDELSVLIDLENKALAGLKEESLSLSSENLIIRTSNDYLLEKKRSIQADIDSLYEEIRVKGINIKSVDTEFRRIIDELDSKKVELSGINTAIQDGKVALADIEAKILSMESQFEIDRKRSSELADMALDLRAKEKSLANRAALVSQRENTLREAQKSV